MYSEIAKNKRGSVFLIGAFLIVIILLCWVISLAFDNTWILYGGIAFTVGYSIISYYKADSMIMAISRAKEIKKSDNPTLWRTIENLCIADGLPMPKVYIIEDSAPNAFATGRDPKHASVAITTGLLDKLDKPELEGVMAHELSHVKNYDVRFMTLVVILVGVIVLISDWFLRFTLFSDRDDNSQFQTIMLIVGIALALLAPLVGFLLQMAFSRKREYLADSSAGLLTRYPEGLASALEKIEADTEPLEAANRATANLYIINPLRDNVEGKKKMFVGLFSSHPPTSERIKRLRKMETKA